LTNNIHSSKISGSAFGLFLEKDCLVY